MQTDPRQPVPEPSSPAPHLDAPVYRALFEAYPDGVLLVDAQGRVVLANQAAERLLGYTVDQLVGLSVETLVPDSVRMRHAGLRQGFLLAPRARPMGTEMELAARRADGREVTVEIALSPLHEADATYVVVAMRGIEAYPRVLRALQRARYAEYTAQLSRLAVDTRDPRELLNCLPAFAATALEVDAVAVWMLESGPAEFRIASKYSAAADLSEALPVANRPDTMLGYVAASGTPLIVSNYLRDNRFRVAPDLRKDGARSGLAVPLIDNGRVIGVLLANSSKPGRFDDEEQKFLEALANLLVTSLQRAHTEAQLNHSQRLESVGQLTGGIAHDFNNLLTVILGNLQMLADHAELSHNQACLQMVNAASRAGQRGAELTSKLLAFARRQTLAPGPVDIAALLHSLGDMLRRTIGEHIRVEIHAPDGCPNCLADAGLLESALLNIAINARDAMPEGGVLSFSCGSAVLPADLAPAGEGSGEFVAVSVKDNGSGMSDEVRDRAFEPFFTTKVSGKGTGLGLSTVYGFVTQSKGRIKVDSALGRGTTVTLFLPAVVGVVASAPTAGPAGLLPSPGLRVMLVEDDADVRQVALGFLASMDCEVSAHPSAESALAALQQQSSCDLLFSDIMLGAGMSGTELAARARALRPDLPVLLSTGFSEQMSDRQPGNPPSRPLLQKPYSREELARAIALALS